MSAREDCDTVLRDGADEMLRQVETRRGVEGEAAEVLHHDALDFHNGTFFFQRDVFVALTPQTNAGGQTNNEILSGVCHDFLLLVEWFETLTTQKPRKRCFPSYCAARNLTKR